MNTINHKKEKLEAEPIQKLEQAYFKAQRLNYRTDITKIDVGDFTYYVSFGAKKDNVLTDHCQVVAYIDDFGIYALGYAFDSDGFPYDRTKHPLLEQKVELEKIKNFDIDKNYLCVLCEHENKPWKFKFDSKKLTHNWIALLLELKGKRQAIKKAAQRVVENATSTELDEQSQQKPIESPQATKEVENIKHAKSMENLSGPQKQKASHIEPPSADVNQEGNLVRKPSRTESKPAPDKMDTIFGVNEAQAKGVFHQDMPPERMIHDNGEQKEQKVKIKDRCYKYQREKESDPESEDSRKSQEQTEQKESWKNKYEAFKKEYRDLTYLVFKKDEQIEALRNRFNNEESGELAKKLEKERSEVKAKDKEIEQLKEKLEEGKQKEKKIQTLNQQVEEQKKKNEQLQKLLDQIKKRMANKNPEQKNRDHPHNTVSKQIGAPEAVIKQLRKNVEAKKKAIKMLHQQNKELKQKINQESQLSSAKGSRKETSQNKN